MTFSKAVLLCCALPLMPAAVAQTLTGSLGPGTGKGARTLVLWSAVGQDHVPLDTVPVDAKGRFSLPLDHHPSGFYQLSIHDTDRVDLILDPREHVVELRFDDRPLREHITVLRSPENQRLWEYKRASRSFGLEMAALKRRRGASDPGDAAGLHMLDSLEKAAMARREAVLERLMSQDRSSYFTKVVSMDKRLTAAIPDGTLAIRDAMEWDDASLVRSTVYPKAIMAILQSAVPATTEVLWNASDSLMEWAVPDPVCWRFMRSFLIRFFSEYAADELVQHLVDGYVTGPHAIHPPEPELLQLIAAQLRVAVGSIAPDILLPDPLGGDTVLLSQVAAGARCTALFFYSSTCDHCHGQMPGLVRTYNELHPRGLQVIGIALDDDREDLVRTIAEEHLSFPCFSELNAWGSRAAKEFAVKATPTFIVLDGHGTIIGKPYGHEELRAMVLPLLD